MACPVPIPAIFRFIAVTASIAFASTPLRAEQDISQAASDPTALLQAHQFQDLYTPNYHGDGGALGNTLQYRGAFPFTLGGVDNLERITVPYVTESPSGETGFSDTTLFDLVIFNKEWASGAPVSSASNTSETSMTGRCWPIPTASEGLTIHLTKWLTD